MAAMESIEFEQSYKYPGRVNPLRILRLMASAGIRDGARRVASARRARTAP